MIWFRTNCVVGRRWPCLGHNLFSRSIYILRMLTTSVALSRDRPFRMIVKINIQFSFRTRPRGRDRILFCHRKQTKTLSGIGKSYTHNDFFRGKGTLALIFNAYEGDCIIRGGLPNVEALRWDRFRNRTIRLTSLSKTLGLRE